MFVCKIFLAINLFGEAIGRIVDFLYRHNIVTYTKVRNRKGIILFCYRFKFKTKSVCKPVFVQTLNYPNSEYIPDDHITPSSIWYVIQSICFNILRKDLMKFLTCLLQSYIYVHIYNITELRRQAIF